MDRQIIVSPQVRVSNQLCVVNYTYYTCYYHIIKTLPRLDQWSHYQESNHMVWSYIQMGIERLHIT